ncbi:hypothetical protein [Natronococcus roseus]
MLSSASPSGIRESKQSSRLIDVGIRIDSEARPTAAGEAVVVCLAGRDEVIRDALWEVDIDDASAMCVTDFAPVDGEFDRSKAVGPTVTPGHEETASTSRTPAPFVSLGGTDVMMNLCNARR